MDDMRSILRREASGYALAAHALGTSMVGVRSGHQAFMLEPSREPHYDDHDARHEGLDVFGMALAAVAVGVAVRQRFTFFR
jgi:hypothetical protein